MADYDVFAEVYDSFMSHVDYGEWAEYIDNLLKKYGQGVKSIVDCGCGTGSLSGELKLLSYNVSSFDFSFSMVKKAGEKNLATLWQGDMCAIPLKKEWDSAVCLYDSFQYLQKEEIPLFLNEIKRILIPGGMFITDLVPELHLISYWYDFTEKDSIGKWEIDRASRLFREKREQHTDFVFTNKQTKEVFYEHHIQYVYSIKEICRLLEENGFSVEGVFDEFSENSGTEYSDRVHILCRAEE
ncbi:hypothetical protein DRQ07_06610 [candidate division KSB1 bacterium]|nr:MAG: hypothetical protein DRQ07_06610 [candidate division KSB1 bacterium]